MHYLFIFSSLWTILLHCSFLVFAHLTVKGSSRKYTSASGIVQYAINGILLHCNLSICNKPVIDCLQICRFTTPSAFAILFYFFDQRIISKFVVLWHLVHLQSFFLFFDRKLEIYLDLCTYSVFFLLKRWVFVAYLITS